MVRGNPGATTSILTKCIQEKASRLLRFSYYNMEVPPSKPNDPFMGEMFPEYRCLSAESHSTDDGSFFKGRRH